MKHRIKIRRRDGVKQRYWVGRKPKIRAFMRTDPQEIIAYKRFGKQNLKQLPVLGQGRDRLVFQLGKDKVLKIAKNPGGVNQNRYERDLDYLGHIKHFETGKDYAIMEKADKPGIATTKFIRPFKKLSAEDFKTHSSKFQKAFTDANLDDFMNYSLASGDFSRKANWGEKQGKPVLIDAGVLHGDSLRRYRVKDYEAIKQIDPSKSVFELEEWKDIQRERRRFR